MSKWMEEYRKEQSRGSDRAELLYSLKCHYGTFHAFYAIRFARFD